MQKDPVCGMKVDEKKRKKLFTSSHEGRTLYFCSMICKNRFDRDPDKYAHSLDSSRIEDRLIVL